MPVQVPAAASWEHSISTWQSWQMMVPLCLSMTLPGSALAQLLHLCWMLPAQGLSMSSRDQIPRSSLREFPLFGLALVALPFVGLALVALPFVALALVCLALEAFAF